MADYRSGPWGMNYTPGLRTGANGQPYWTQKQYDNWKSMYGPVAGSITAPPTNQDPWWDYGRQSARPYLEGYSGNLGHYGAGGSKDQWDYFEGMGTVDQFNTVANALGWQNTGNPYVSYLSRSTMPSNWANWRVQEDLNSTRPTPAASTPYAEFLANRAVIGSTAPVGGTAGNTYTAQYNQSLQNLKDLAMSDLDLGGEPDQIEQQARIATEVIGGNLSQTGKAALSRRIEQMRQAYVRDAANLGPQEPNFYRYVLHRMGILPVESGVPS